MQRSFLGSIKRLGLNLGDETQLDILQKSSSKNNMDVTDWLLWFLECFQRAILNSEKIIMFEEIYNSKLASQASNNMTSENSIIKLN